jgi:catechol 2,3-dioxygenase-like lactoylglutathione lyase family enzyme
MQQRLDVVTLGVPDLERARRFYVDGLGWEPALVVDGEVVFLQVGHGRLLALFGADALEADIQASGTAAADDVRTAGVTLGHNVATEAEVAEVLERAAAAGGTVLKPAQRAAFGGFHGFFADPAGFRWEVVHNPGWSVDADGRVRIAPVAG